MNNIISYLETRFETLKDNFANNKATLALAIIEAEDILENAKMILNELNTISSDNDEVKIRLSKLIKQTNETLEFFIDLSNSKEMNA